jgi:hypothetical protein
MNQLVRIICAWCHRVIQPGPDGPVSHGCCDACLKVALEEGR